mmetsp:Transcript_30501/g.63012  ORF Transcript_30501/g.63012 Transcript_30501/m.63012 type:complete len:183 (+) Transcript_30501:149-697(+)
MDADWGSSSDEEEASERQRKDEAKKKETLALLDQFAKTREVEALSATEKGYGSMDAAQRFYAERSQAAGKAMYAERLDRKDKEAAEQIDIDSSMKVYALIGVCICGVLSVVLGLMYYQFNHVIHSADNGKNVHDGHTKIGKTHMPPMTVIFVAVALGITIPTTVLLCRQFKSRRMKKFAAER